MKKYKVLGFDGWTQGSHHFLRLIQGFHNYNLELSLLHLGSWGDEKGRPPIEYIGDLEVKDISFYKDKNFLEILKSENPDAVIFLSTDTIAHRAFNRFCKLLNIPTLYLFHGILNVVALETKNGEININQHYNKSVISHFRFVLKRVPKLVKHSFLTYCSALWQTNASLTEWNRFLFDGIRGIFGKHSKVSAKDARTTKCCVFVPADVSYAIKRYGFRREDITVVGNPDFLKYGLTEEMIGSYLKSEFDKYDNVLYIDTAFLISGLIFNGIDDYILHLVKIKNELLRQGKRMIFKPHPATLHAGFVTEIEKAGIQICLNDDLSKILRNSCACLTEPSSLSILPTFLGIPIFLINFGKLKMQLYGKLLLSYPGSSLLKDLSQLSYLLDTYYDRVDINTLLHWIEQHFGSNPLGDMPKLVGMVVESMINDNNKEN